MSARVIVFPTKKRKPAPAELAPREQLQYLVVHWHQLTDLAREGIMNTAAFVLGEPEVYPVLRERERREREE